MEYGDIMTIVNEGFAHLTKVMTIFWSSAPNPLIDLNTPVQEVVFGDNDTAASTTDVYADVSKNGSELDITNGIVTEIGTDTVVFQRTFNSGNYPTGTVAEFAVVFDPDDFLWLPGRVSDTLFSRFTFNEFSNSTEIESRYQLRIDV